MEMSTPMCFFKGNIGIKVTNSLPTLASLDYFKDKRHQYDCNQAAI